MTVQDTIAEREVTHGGFTGNAHMSVNLIETMADASGWKALPNEAKMALMMIQAKVSRVINSGDGNPDNWRDIAGYALLAEERHA